MGWVLIAEGTEVTLVDAGYPRDRGRVVTSLERGRQRDRGSDRAGVEGEGDLARLAAGRGALGTRHHGLEIMALNAEQVTRLTSVDTFDDHPLDVPGHPLETARA